MIYRVKSIAPLPVAETLCKGGLRTSEEYSMNFNNSETTFNRTFLPCTVCCLSLYCQFFRLTLRFFFC